MEAPVTNQLRSQRRYQGAGPGGRGVDHCVRMLDGDHRRRVQGDGDPGDICINISEEIECFADIEAVDDPPEHSDGDEPDDLGEDGGDDDGEQALDDGDQLCGPDIGEGCQGEAEDRAESWSRQDHDAGTGA